MDIFGLDLDYNMSVISPMWPESDFSITDADADAILAFADTGDLSTNNNFVWDVDSLPSQDTEHFYYNDSSTPVSSVNNETVLDSWQDADNCNFDTLKDGLFELEVFGNCLNEIDNQSEAPTYTSMPTCDVSSTKINVDPIAEWNRRRSLLYDKNEFVPNEMNRERHEQQVRRRKPASSGTAPETSIDQRTFRCSVRDCDKTYYKASHLKSHMRRHSGVKPFACDWDGCKWRFSRSDELARHKRSHSGIKPYSCNLCDKAFSRSDHLSKHAKVHMKKLALYGTPIITKKCNYKYLTVNRVPPSS